MHTLINSASQNLADTGDPWTLILENHVGKSPENDTAQLLCGCACVRVTTCRSCWGLAERHCGPCCISDLGGSACACVMVGRATKGPQNSKGLRNNQLPVASFRRKTVWAMPEMVTVKLKSLDLV